MNIIEFNKQSRMEKIATVIGFAIAVPVIVAWTAQGFAANDILMQGGHEGESPEHNSDLSHTFGSKGLMMLSTNQSDDDKHRT